MLYDRANKNKVVHRLPIQAYLFQVALLGLEPNSKDGFSCVDMAICLDCTVGVQKGGFAVETFC